MSLPESLEIIPLAKPPNAVIGVPGSKSITNRALVLAALSAKGRDCELCGALRSEDTEVMIEALRKLGFQVHTDWEKSTVSIGSEEEHELIPASEVDLYVANSGTTMRFLAAMLGLRQGRYRLDGSPRMRERPIEDLLVALRLLGVNAYSERRNGCPPVVIEANGLSGGRVKIKGDVSSQFLSGLLMVAPFARENVIIEVEGELVSRPYVSMTVAMMRQWGMQIEVDFWKRFHIPSQQPDIGISSFVIEPDAAAASYFFGAAAVTGGKVQVEGLTTASLQGDIRFVELLEEMGCHVVRGKSGITVSGGALHGIDADMNDISDCVMTLAAVACFAEGPTTIRNVAHIRHKESDRLAALAVELRKVGVGVEEFADGLKIKPASMHGAVLETYDDHRLAMSLALIGLKVPGIVIRNPGCVAKTYPGFFTDLERLR